jgi:hypothetical protein
MTTVEQILFMIGSKESNPAAKSRVWDRMQISALPLPDEGRLAAPT